MILDVLQGTVVSLRSKDSTSLFAVFMLTLLPVWLEGLTMIMSTV